MTLREQKSSIHYILVDGFREKNQARTETNEHDRQLKLLNNILLLTDLHDANYGVDG